MHIIFSYEETPVVYEMIDLLQKRIADLNYAKADITSKPARNEKINTYLQSRKDFDLRFKKYFYEILIIVQEKDWKPNFEKWIDKLSPETEIEIKFHNLSTLETQLFNRVIRNRHEWYNPFQTMAVQIMYENGYHQGIEILKSLYEECDNEEYRKTLSMWLEDAKLLEQFKEELVEIALKESDYHSNLLQWVKEMSQKVNSKEMISKVISAFQTYINYDLRFENNELLREAIVDVGLAFTSSAWNKGPRILPDEPDIDE